eukprot:CAMPEP_0204919434 /NCGR_PEP_ID=MMETSP1397-20131031/16819_1 /ASSEMBLY_ACC=CAM_ASM_000891 /TAXON_ID=49980 /ORGANISM="Climacostomum Climacostomum virens, Strain Stock W-24" /LENGTH=304 /DNA_ID=CAMNT_0052093025 /DNA_START=8 /DNA_END=919 /DNA_ORIENTATION=+
MTSKAEHPGKLANIPLNLLNTSQDFTDLNLTSNSTEAATVRHSKDCNKRADFLVEELEGDEYGRAKTEGDVLWDEHTEETMSEKDPSDTGHVHPTLPLERFVGAVDEFFICAECKGVVDCPRECERCENLLCEGCVDSECPYGCDVLETKDPALYARIVYSRLQVKCQFYLNGCDFFESVGVVKDHEQCCLMRIETCKNPLCSNLYRLWDRPEGAREVCSAMCDTIHKFSCTLDSCDKGAILQHFVSAISSVKDQLRDELRAELAYEHEQLDREKEVLAEYEEERMQLSKELHLRMISMHPGKW